MMPHEVRTFALEYGPDITADPEPRGLEVKSTSDGFEIRNGSHLTWTVGRNPLSLLKSVDAGELQHLRPAGARLAIEDAQGVLDQPGDETRGPRIVRSGPSAVAIRYEFAGSAARLAETKSTIDLTFPVSKSWVQVDWRIDDPRKAVRSARLELAQNLAAPTDKEPTLVDFGAASLVYLALLPGTVGKLQATARVGSSPAAAHPSWTVLRGMPDRLEPFVVGSAAVPTGAAEGWAHIMDRTRCLALAVDEFGRDGDDSIETTAEGNVTLVRRFLTGEVDHPATKNFLFWLHFVGFPPHVTAATSPQSMLSPLAVRVSKP
jgi:hypothetical protein